MGGILQNRHRTCPRSPLNWAVCPALPLFRDQGIPLSIRPGGFLELAELIDLNPALGEHGFNLQLASHGSNHGLQSADVHIGAALHLGDRGLVDAEQVGQMLLGQFSGFSKLGGARFSSGAEARNILVFTARLKSCPSQTACHPEQGIEAQRQTRKSSCRRGKPSAQILRVAQDDSAGGDDRGVASPLSHVSKGARRGAPGQMLLGHFSGLSSGFSGDRARNILALGTTKVAPAPNALPS